MAAYRFLNPTGLYPILNDIEAQIAAGQWDSAAIDVVNVEDEAHYQQSAGSVQLWHDFIGHTENLQLAIKGRDQLGCVEELAMLHSTLLTIAGPEIKLVAKEE